MRVPSLCPSTLVAGIVRAVVVFSVVSVSGCSNGASGDPPWDWNGVVGTGQSLSVGTTPITSTTQPFHNLKLSLGSVKVPPWIRDEPGVRDGASHRADPPAGDGLPQPLPAATSTARRRTRRWGTRSPSSCRRPRPAAITSPCTRSSARVGRASPPCQADGQHDGHHRTGLRGDAVRGQRDHAPRPGRRQERTASASSS